MQKQLLFSLMLCTVVAACGDSVEANSGAAASTGKTMENIAACQDKGAFPNPHSQSDDRYKQHKTCLHYVDLIPGIIAYADKPEHYKTDSVKQSLGIGGETIGSVRDTILGHALDMAYAGKQAEAIERGIFCDCLSYPADAFYEDFAPMAEVRQLRVESAAYAAVGCDQQMEGLARAAMMRFVQGASDEQVGEYLSGVVGEAKTIDFLNAMSASEDAFDDEMSDYHQRGCR